MKTITISYNDYLVESKLNDILTSQLKEYFTTEVHTKIANKYYADFVINTKTKKYLVEFDGYQHYTNAHQIINDIKKDSIWIQKEGQNSIIRIPYFVQLTTETFNYYFNFVLQEQQIAIEVNSNYPHGFIDKKVVYPANFCGIGEKRFIHELNTLPCTTAISIIDSLFNKLGNKNIEEIFPLYLNKLSDVYNRYIQGKLVGINYVPYNT
jgi:hypothetical protein